VIDERKSKDYYQDECFHYSPEDISASCSEIFQNCSCEKGDIHGTAAEMASFRETQS
jgi:hypothetical protein